MLRTNSKNIVFVYTFNFFAFPDLCFEIATFSFNYYALTSFRNVMYWFCWPLLNWIF